MCWTSDINQARRPHGPSACASTGDTRGTMHDHPETWASGALTRVNLVVEVADLHHVPCSRRLLASAAATSEFAAATSEFSCTSEFYMLPLIASCLLAWSVNGQERLTDGAAMVPNQVQPQGLERKASTWGLTDWALDELGSKEWRAMMTSLIKAKEKQRQTASTASSRIGCAGVGCGKNHV